jgi:hypothetical protein
MKNLRTFGAALALTLVLSVSAFAGIIECPVAPPPPPSAAIAASGPDAESTASHIETGVAPTDPVTEAALLLLQSVLALF